MISTTNENLHGHPLTGMISISVIKFYQSDAVFANDLDSWSSAVKPIHNIISLDLNVQCSEANHIINLDLMSSAVKPTTILLIIWISCPVQ